MNNPSDDKITKIKLGNKKICRIGTVPYYMVSQLKGQVEYLRDQGLSVVMMCSDGPELQKVLWGDGLYFEKVEIPRSLSVFKDIRALLRLVSFFRYYRFDIVHSTTPKAGMLAAVAAFLCRIPVRLHTFTGQPWVTLSGPMRYFAIFADKLIGKLNTHCYADSASQRQFLINKSIVGKDKISVIGEGSLAGVDLERFDPKLWSDDEKEELKKKHSINQNASIITFIGRITGDKGIRELLKAFDSLIEKTYEIDLFLIGPLDQDVGGENTKNGIGIENHARVHYTGYIDAPERYLAISDIFCLPSYREGFGTVVIEAAAMGIPTVGTEITGLQDAVDNGNTGLLVPSGDAQALQEALQLLLDDRKLREKMGEKARQRCIEKFDSNIVNSKTAAEYQRLLSKAH